MSSDDGQRSTAQRYDQALTEPGSEPAFNDDGVDLTQVRAALARTPLERLVHHEASANSLRWLLRAARKQRPDVEPL